MIKKSTKIIFQDGDSKGLNEFEGSLPLAKGDIVHVHRETLSGSDYEVVEKMIDCFIGEEEQIIDITYTLKEV